MAKRPPTSCRWSFNFCLRRTTRMFFETTDFMSVVLQFQPTTTRHFGSLETTDFMSVVLQFQPTTDTPMFFETTDFMSVVLQFQASAKNFFTCAVVYSPTVPA